MSVRHKRGECIVLVSAIFGFGVPATAQTHTEDIKFVSSEERRDDFFGISVAATSGVIAVGEQSDIINGSESGSASIFDASTGDLIAQLIANDASGRALFGCSIAIDGDLVAVGARGDDENGTGSGAAYLFDATTGVQLHKLLPDDGGKYEAFGHSIDIDDGLVVVGSPNAVVQGYSWGAFYVFDATTGLQIARLHPDDGTSRSNLGYNVAIENGIVVAGASGADNKYHQSSGAAYLFDARTGKQLAKFHSSVPEHIKSFGLAVDISDGIIAVGARRSAYLFDLGSLDQLHAFERSDQTGRNTFGKSVALGNGVLVVGDTEYEDDNSGRGTAYLFRVSNGHPLARLVANDGEEGDEFGFATAADRGIVVVGAPFNDGSASNSGAAYFYKLGSRLELTASSPCPDAGPGRLTASGGSGGRILFVYGPSAGRSVFARGHHCAGTVLDISAPVRLVGAAEGDPAILRIPRVPANACGAIAVQALDIETCGKSNAVRLE